MPLPIGTRLGSFVIEASIGEGGMGQVYRARDSKLGRDVAIKVLILANTGSTVLDPDAVRTRLAVRCRARWTIPDRCVFGIDDHAAHVGG